MTLIHRQGVVGLIRAFADGATTPLEAFDAYTERIAALNPGLGAFLHLRLEDAQGEAEAAAVRRREGRVLSSLDGVPFGAKANIAVAGLPWHAGVAAYRSRIAREDAGAVVALKRAGAVCLGVLNMHEGALGATTDNPHFGRCRNPWNAALTPGGSSGGSAAAVAAGLCAFALGTDTMGSVRIPSAYCGIAGIKPTSGLIRGRGLIDLSPTLDTIGVHAGTAEDLDVVMSALAPLRRAPAPEPRLKIAVAGWGVAVAVEDAVLAAFEAAALLMPEIGEAGRCDVSEFDFGALRRRGLLVSEIEGHQVHRAMLAADRDGFSPEFRGLLEYAARQPAERIKEAYTDIRAASARFAEVFRDADVVVMPTAPQGPFAFGAEVPANQADFTCIANFGGFPAVAVPAAREGAPPASIQFIAAKGNDALALAAARAFEQARGAAPLPPLSSFFLPPLKRGGRGGSPR